MSSIRTMKVVIPYLNFAVIILALFLFFFSDNYAKTISENSFLLTNLITSITSVFSTHQSAITPSLESPGFSMYEDKAVFVLFALSFFLLVTVVINSTWFRFRHGLKILYLHNLLLSLALMMSLLFVGNKIGLASYL